MTQRTPWPMPALIVGTLAACSPMLVYPMGADQAFYAYGGWVLREGGVPGIDWSAQTPPLTGYLYALSQLLFGHTSMAIRWWDLGWSVATAVSLAALVRRLHGAALGALAGGLWAWSYGANSDYWGSAQVDGFLTLPAVWVIALAQRGCTERRPHHWWIAGAVLAQAFMIKYIALSLLLPLVAMLWVSRSPPARRLVPPLVRLGGGFVLGLAPWLLGLALSGSLPASFEMQRDLSGGYTSLALLGGPGRMFGRLWPGLRWLLVTHTALIALCGLGLLSLRSRPPLERALAAGWLAAAGLGYLAQLKAFPYHSLTLLAPMAVLAALALRDLVRAPRWVRIGCLCLLAATQIAALGRFAAGWVDLVRVAATPLAASDLWRRQPRVWSGIEIGERIRAETSAAETLYVWGYEPLIHFVAQRRSASRLLFIAPLVVPWGNPAWRGELVRDLELRRPSHIVVCHDDAIPWVTGIDADSAALLGDFPELQRLIREEFRLAWRAPSYSVYRRRDGWRPRLGP